MELATNGSTNAKTAALAASNVRKSIVGTSPFSDGYPIDEERQALKDIVDSSDPDTLDPRYNRYIELERREGMLLRMKESHRQADQAQPEVPHAEAVRVKNLGRLTDDGEDTMSIHTREASRLFIGRAKAPGEGGYPQSGGKKVGAALRAIWYLSEGDNPYADFALIEAHAAIESRIQVIESVTASMQAQLKKLLDRGLSFSVIRADPPVTVDLGFKSPYGYSVVRLISSFDYFARHVKTLVRKDLLANQEGHDSLFGQAHACRGIFERVVWFQRLLMRDQMRALSRADWLPTADAQAKLRVRAAVALAGELPREVFAGKVQPRHSRRHVTLSPEELRMLNELPLAGEDHILDADSERLQ